MDANKLVINPDKTHLMVLGPKKTVALKQQVSIMAGDFKVVPSDTEKLLGGHIHHSLKWNYHLCEAKSSLLKQIISRNNALKRVCQNAKFKTKLMLANGAIHSKLVYLINIWGGAPQYLLKALQVQQLVAARTVCGYQSLRWSKYKLLKKTGWLSVRQLVQYYCILQAHKTLRTGKPAVLHAALSSLYPYQTRSASQGNIRLDRNISVNSFTYRAMVSYNQVPSKVKEGSLLTVKRNLKKWIQHNTPLDYS